MGTNVVANKVVAAIMLGSLFKFEDPDRRRSKPLRTTGLYVCVVYISSPVVVNCYVFLLDYSGVFNETTFGSCNISGSSSALLQACHTLYVKNQNKIKNFMTSSSL